MAAPQGGGGAGRTALDRVRRVDDFGGDAVFRRTDRHDRGNEAIAQPRQGLDEARRLGRVAERIAQLHHRDVDALLEFDVGAARPEARAQRPPAKRSRPAARASRRGSDTAAPGAGLADPVAAVRGVEGRARNPRTRAGAGAGRLASDVANSVREGPDPAPRGGRRPARRGRTDRSWRKLPSAASPGAGHAAAQALD